MQAHVTMLKGNWFQRQSVLKKIKDTLSPCDISVYDNADSYNIVERDILENSCFSETKLIIITDYPMISAPNKTKARAKVLSNLREILHKVPENTFVVLNNIETRSKKFIKYIEEVGKVFDFEKTISKSRSMVYINKILENMEKTIDEDAINIVLDSLSKGTDTVNIDDIMLLFRKIENYVGKRSKIKYEDVIKICTDSEDFIIWTLLNSLDTRDYKRCLEIIDILSQKSSNSLSQDIYPVFSMLMWKYRLLLITKDNFLRGLNQKETWEVLSKMIKFESKGNNFKRVLSPKKNKNGTNASMYSYGAFKNLFNGYGKTPSVKCYNKEDLLYNINIIEEAIITIRMGCTDSEARGALELVCLAICKAIPRNDSLKTILKNKESYWYV